MCDTMDSSNSKVAWWFAFDQKLFTHVCLCHQAVQFGTSLTAGNV